MPCGEQILVFDVFSTFDIFLECFFWINTKITIKENETDNATTTEATMTITILPFLFSPPILTTKALNGRKPWILPHRSLLLLKAPGVANLKIFPSGRGPSKLLFDRLVLAHHAA